MICAGQEPRRELLAALQAAGVAVHVIGGADVAVELDAKRAIDQGSRLAAALCSRAQSLASDGPLFQNKNSNLIKRFPDSTFRPGWVTRRYLARNFSPPARFGGNRRQPAIPRLWRPG